MKYRYFLAIPLCFAFLHSAEAQNNNALTYVKNNSHAKDSLEALVFQRLVDFISKNDPGIKATEGGSDSLGRIGEEHQLVIPYARGVAPEPTQNSSWDKSLPTVYNKEALQGSPFLLSAYVPGLVVNELDTVIDKPDYLYNYDKMSGNFLLKRDNEKPIAVNKAQVKQFCLKTAKGGYIFERVSLINPDEFFQVLFKGSGYSFYKQYKSKFVPANQHTNGYLSEGKDYDEYQDIYIYYLVDQAHEESLIFDLTKKSIMKSLPSETAAVEAYFKQHKNEGITESYVVRLIEQLNK